MTTTTLTALTTDDGIAVDYVCVIEGYGYLLTSGDPAAAVTAWSGTDWSAAIGGLSVQAKLGQKLDPWRPFGEGSELTFTVIPCTGQSAGTDRFGEDVWNRTGGVSSDLAANIDCNDTSLTVLRADDFAASGTIYLENEAMAYSSRNTGTDIFTISTRGKYAPFTTESAARFSHAHRLVDTALDAGGVHVPPTVTSLPRNWVGSLVAVYIHQRLGTTLATKANAHLAFAGRIKELHETESGATVVTCEDIRASVNGSVILRSQYTAKVAEGVYLQTGVKFTGETAKNTGGVLTTKTFNALTVVASGASGANEINSGLHTVEALAAKFNEWLTSEKVAVRSLFDVAYIAYAQSASGTRPVLTMKDSAGTATRLAFVYCNDGRVAKSLGWNDESYIKVESTNANASGFGASVPMRICIPKMWGLAASRLAVENPRGTWVDQGDLLPGPLQGSTGGDWEGVLQVGDLGRVLAYQDGDAFYYKPIKNRDYQVGNFADPSSDQMIVGVSVDDDGDMVVSQVLIAEAPFSTLLREILSSTGTASFNNSYDVLGESLGCGIPHSLIDSLVDIDLPNTQAADRDLTLIVDKPTRFDELFTADFLIRKTFLVWSQGELRLASWATPTGNYASITLDETNKAAPIANRDRMRSSAVESDDWMRNVIKFKYGRRADGTYRDAVNIEDAASVRMYGAKPLTIELRNVAAESALSVDALVTWFREWLPILARPVVRIRRTMARTLFETTVPGSHASVTDEHVRDWATGLRGITSRAALVVGHWYDYGGADHGDDGPPSARPPSGELDLLMFPTNVATYAPAAQIDDTATNGGYDNATKTLTCYAHKYSESGETADAARFVASDKIRIIEIDPADPAAPDTWTRTVASQTGNTIVMTTTLSSPSWTSTKKYRVTYDSYANCQATQQTKAFQGDSADGLIVDTLAAYEYSQFTGPQSSTVATNMAATELPARYAQASYGDGVPLDTGVEYDVARMVNNLVSFKTAPQCPHITLGREYQGASDWWLVEFGPIYFGPGTGITRATGKRTRKLYVAPILKVSSGTGHVRVTIMPGIPYGNGLESGQYTFPDPYAQATFSTTSTSYEVATKQGLSLGHMLTTLGWGWIAVEVDASTTFGGFSVQYVGPLETA